MPATRRVHGWEAALVAYADAQLGRSFAWGSTDCGSLVHGGLAAMYAVAPLLHPLYNSLKGARERFTAMGGDVAAWLGANGAEAVTRHYMQAGDVVLLRPTRRPRGLPSLGIAPSSSRLLVCTRKAGPQLMRAGGIPGTATVWRFPS